MSLIEVKGLTKHYGDVHAVRGLDLTIEQGEIFSILGPNGAGKTTTVEILEGFRKRDSGSVSVLGFDPGTKGHQSREWRDRIGIVLQTSADAGDLTVFETINHFSGYYSNPREVEEVIDKRTELVDFEIAQILETTNHPDADKLKIKTDLVIQIIKALERLHLTQAEAAKRMGISQPKVSAMINGDFSNLSERKLMDCLTHLGYNIEIRVKPVRKPMGSLRVALV